MTKCEYFRNCGSPGMYECENDGKMPSKSLGVYCSNKIRLDFERSVETIDDREFIEYDREELRGELERAAATIGDEIASLDEATRVTRETLNIEFTI